MQLALVNPDGKIGVQNGVFTMCGNRGQIDDGRKLIRQYRHQHWIYCVTSALCDPGEFMTAGTYTDLFFLDEATALAAGHRPCGRCNKKRFDNFIHGWKETFPSFEGGPDEIDLVLASERMEPDGGKKVFLTESNDVPEGAMVRVDGDAFLLANQMMYPWTLTGYGRPLQIPSTRVEVLTPPSVVLILRRRNFRLPLTNLVMSW